jgi:hypothetical protein
VDRGHGVAGKEEGAQVGKGPVVQLRRRWRGEAGETRIG